MLGLWHAFAALVVAVLGVTSVVALVASSGPAGAAPEGVIALDTMQRSVAAGFGSANVGGAYTVSSKANTDVARGAAHFTGIRPGGSVAARLDKARGADVTAALTFAVPARLPGGSGLYIYEELRRQPNGAAYAVKVRIQQNGQLSLEFSRFQNGRETALGVERRLFRAARGQVLTVEGQASGTTAVSLGAALWVGSSTVAPRVVWQSSYTDTSGARLTSAGSLALMAYQSRGARSTTSLSMRHFQAWVNRQGPTGGPTPPPPSSSSAPAPTSSAPATHSSGSSSHSATPTTPASSSSSSSSSAPPPSNGSPSRAGSAPLGQTAYPVPSGAVFVSPGGNDSAAGTEGAPFRTLARAVAAARSGATIVLRGGTYHESVNTPSNKTLTIQAYPHEAVWLDGSTAVTGWTQHGSTWVHSGWTAHFDSSASSTCNTTGNTQGWVNAQHPMAAHPDQVWVDGTPLNQVGSASEVGPGDFYVDYSTDQLVVGSNPAGHQVQASDLAVALSTYGADSMVRGIGVRRYAASICMSGALRLDGVGDRVQNVIVTQNAVTGLAASRTGETVDHVTAIGNGLLGITAHYADGLFMSNVLATQNNTQGFNFAPQSGGIKITGTRGVTVTDSDVSGNNGPGLWLDESCYDMTIVHNRMVGNAGHGMSIEISAKAIVADNVVTGNGMDGMKLNDSDDLQVWANTVTGNHRNVEIVQDFRRGTDVSHPGHDSRRPDPDPTEPWIIENIQFNDNFLGTQTGDYSIFVRDASGEYSASMLNITVDGNRLVKPSSGAEFLWQIKPVTYAIYSSVAQFIAATGQGQHNSEQSGGSTLFAQVTPTPLPIPSGVAAAMGVPAGSRQTGAS